MDIYTQADFPYVYETIQERLLNGEIAILPTDTIYGLSGNALNLPVIHNILDLKKRINPLSFIPHSLNWVRLLVDKNQHSLFDEYIHDFRGPFTTLWYYSGRPTKLPDVMRSSGLIGIRFPNHWITDLAKDIKVPLITTSVNIHLKPHMTSLDDIPSVIRQSVDFIVYEGPLYGPPSEIVHCYNGIPFKTEKRS